MAYKFNPLTGTLDYFESGGTSSVPDAYIVENRTLSALEASNKKLTLVNAPPIPAKTTLDIINGTPQFYASDFTVIANELTWDGLGLDLTLDQGDKVRIIYPI